MRPTLSIKPGFSLLTFLATCYLVLFCSGCPDDLADPSGASTSGGSTSSSGDSSDSTATLGATGTSGSSGGDSSSSSGGSDSSGGEEGGEEPVVDCALEYTAEANLEEFVEPTATVDASTLCSDLTTISQTVVGGTYPIHVSRPATDSGGSWPQPEPRPWILLQHGNGQFAAGYGPLVEHLVSRGFVVFSPDNGDIPGTGDEIDVNRGEQVLCSLRWIREVYSDRARLGECYGMIGHSNGGSGTVFAAATETTAGAPNGPVGAVVGLAPRDPLAIELPSEQSFPYLGLVGTRDGQTPRGASDSYEQLGRERTHDLTSNSEGSQPGQYGDKALVVAYDVGHNDWGGGPGTDPSLKAQALSAAYILPFFEWQFFGDASGRARFADNEIPSGLDDPAWWNSVAQYDGDPLILTAYQAGNRRGIGMQRLSVATLEGAFPGLGSGGVPSPLLTAAEGVQRDLYDSAVTSTDRNRAMRVSWDAVAGEIGEVTWDFSSPSFSPTHVSFRIHNVFDDWSAGAPTCTAVADEGPLSVDVVVQDAVTQGRARVENIISQDYGALSPGACTNEQTLHTVRIPIDCFTPDDGQAIDASSLQSVQFRFGDDPSTPAGSLVIDSVELTASPEEATSASCGKFGPPPPQESYLCAHYNPVSSADFTRASSPPPGDPLGEMTFDLGFAQYVAARPSMVTECDTGRYERATVAVDHDGDGIAESTEDVRALDQISSSDLLAQLGLENGDAALSINERGKPAANAVQLNDFASFLAAFNRFAALQELEISLYRENTSGVYQPVRLDASVPPGFHGPQPPVAPAAPTSYTIPAGAVLVSTTAELLAELASPLGHDIQLADGVYSSTGPATAAGPHRLWSKQPLGATLEFGVTYAGNPDRVGGLELHGLDFRVKDPSMAPFGVGTSHILYTWGLGGEDVLVEDCTFDGDLAIGNGIGAFAANGLTVRRTTFSNFWANAIFAKQGAAGTVLSSEPLLEDISISGVFDTVPGSSGGARENGILLGNNGTIARVSVVDVGWAGIHLYNDATGVLVSDVDVDFAGPGVWSPSYTNARGAGVWLTHSNDVMIERVRIGEHVFLGLNVMWDGGSGNPFQNAAPARNRNIAVTDVYSRAYKIGLHLDLGVDDVRVSQSRFEHSWMAGILDNNEFEDDLGAFPCPGGEQLCITSTNTVDGTDCYLHSAVACVGHHHHLGPGASPPPGWPTHPSSYAHP